MRKNDFPLNLTEYKNNIFIKITQILFFFPSIVYIYYIYIYASNLHVRVKKTICIMSYKVAIKIPHMLQKSKYTYWTYVVYTIYIFDANTCKKELPPPSRPLTRLFIPTYTCALYVCI